LLGGCLFVFVWLLDWNVVIVSCVAAYDILTGLVAANGSLLFVAFGVFVLVNSVALLFLFFLDMICLLWLCIL